MSTPWLISLILLGLLVLGIAAAAITGRERD